MPMALNPKPQPMQVQEQQECEITAKAASCARNAVTGPTSGRQRKCSRQGHGTWEQETTTVAGGGLNTLEVLGLRMRTSLLYAEVHVLNAMPLSLGELMMLRNTVTII